MDWHIHSDGICFGKKVLRGKRILCNDPELEFTAELHHEPILIIHVPIGLSDQFLVPEMRGTKHNKTFLL